VPEEAKETKETNETNETNESNESNEASDDITIPFIMNDKTSILIMIYGKLCNSKILILRNSKMLYSILISSHKRPLDVIQLGVWSCNYT
jgi:hypothetical protein